MALDVLEDRQTAVDQRRRAGRRRRCRVVGRVAVRVVVTAVVEVLLLLLTLVVLAVLAVLLLLVLLPKLLLLVLLLMLQMLLGVQKGNIAFDSWHAVELLLLLKLELLQLELDQLCLSRNVCRGRSGRCVLATGTSRSRPRLLHLETTRKRLKLLLLRREELLLLLLVVDQMRGEGD